MPAINSLYIDTFPPVGQAIVLSILDGSPPVPMAVLQVKAAKSAVSGDAFVKGIVLKDGVYGEGYHAKSVKAGTEIEVGVAYGDEWRALVKSNPRRHSRRR